MAYEVPSDEELQRLCATDVVMNTITKNIVLMVHKCGGHIKVLDAAKVAHSYIYYARMPEGPFSAQGAYQPPSRDNPGMN